MTQEWTSETGVWIHCRSRPNLKSNCTKSEMHFRRRHNFFKAGRAMSNPGNFDIYNTLKFHFLRFGSEL